MIPELLYGAKRRFVALADPLVEPESVAQFALQGLRRVANAMQAATLLWSLGGECRNDCCSAWTECGAQVGDVAAAVVCFRQEVKHRAIVPDVNERYMPLASDRWSPRKACVSKNRG